MMVIEINKIHVGEVLSDIYGINFVVSEGSGYIDVRPGDLNFGEGFVIRLHFSWRSLICEFIPDNYAAVLIRAMGNASLSQKELFHSISMALNNRSNIRFEMKINNIDTASKDYRNWPDIWKNFQLSMKIMPFVFENLQIDDYEEIVVAWAGKMISLILSLLPMEEVAEQEGDIGLPEGALTRIEVNRYERNLVNRQACLLVNGTNCKVCGFNFESRYGSLGKGFIHVHHIIPVSVLGENYFINPAKDLVPVCPNCHAMLHKRNPPYTIEELKGIMVSCSKTL